MPRRLKKFSRCEGSVAVEFALIFIFILMPLLAGFIDFSGGFYWQHVVTNASREGARNAVRANYSNGVRTPYSDSDIQKEVKNTYGADLVVTVSTPAGTASGAPRSVKVDKTMQWVFIDYLSAIGISIPTQVSNTTTMTME